MKARPEPTRMSAITTLQSDFTLWLDSAMSETMPENLAAFNFNLSEAPGKFQVDVVGATTFDPANSDWACNEAFVPRRRFFDLPHLTVGKEWQKVQQLIRRFVADYISTAPKSSPLRNAKATTVGFVDGDLIQIWPRVNQV